MIDCTKRTAAADDGAVDAQSIVIFFPCDIILKMGCVQWRVIINVKIENHPFKNCAGQLRVLQAAKKKNFDRLAIQLLRTGHSLNVELLHLERTFFYSDFLFVKCTEQVCFNLIKSFS